MLKHTNLYDCIVEGDSKSIISWGRGDQDGPWRFRHFIYEVRILINELKVVLHHVPRAQNVMEDKVAKWSVGQTFVYMGDNMPAC